jgi:hypothetical protein
MTISDADRRSVVQTARNRTKGLNGAGATRVAAASAVLRWPALFLGRAPFDVIGDRVQGPQGAHGSRGPRRRG